MVVNRTAGLCEWAGLLAAVDSGRVISEVMALLHMRRVGLPLTDGGCSEDVVAVASSSQQLSGDGDSSSSPDDSPTHGVEVVGVRGRVQEMVLRFSVADDNGQYTVHRCIAAVLWRPCDSRTPAGLVE